MEYEPEEGIIIKDLFGEIKFPQIVPPKMQSIPDWLLYQTDLIYDLVKK